ncbi:MAG: hypothetical protein AMXMBFR8_30550 [Nevskiales bacterium]
MSAESPAVRPPDIHAHRILILDFGAQYTQLIARRVRECGVYCEIHPWDMGEDEVRVFGVRGVILSGGPESVIDAAPPRAPAAVFESGTPVPSQNDGKDDGKTQPLRGKHQARQRLTGAVDD